jgi:hypothetical protein
MGTPKTRWSKAVLVSNTFITAYALLVLVAIHHHRGGAHFHGPEGAEGPHHHGMPVYHHAQELPRSHKSVEVRGGTMDKLEIDLSHAHPRAMKPQAALGRAIEVKPDEAKREGAAHAHAAHAKMELEREEERAMQRHSRQHEMEGRQEEERRRQMEEVRHERREHHARADVRHHKMAAHRPSVSHSHRGPSAHSQPPRHCCLAKVAALLLVTGLTGMAASLTNNRRVATCFLVLLLAVEFALLIGIGHAQHRAIKTCIERSERVAVITRIQQVRVGDTTITEVDQAVSKPFIDVPVERDCEAGVRHSAFMACLIVGVIFSSLACCGSRLLRSIRVEEHEAAMAKVNAANIIDFEVVVVVPALPAKADPLADEEFAERAVLIK